MTKARSNATAPAAKGEIVAGTGSELSGIISVGANGTVLTANSATATGLQWVAPSSGGMTLLSTTNITGSTFATTIDNINQSYNDLYIVMRGVRSPNNGRPGIGFRNGTTTWSNRQTVLDYNNAGVLGSSTSVFSAGINWGNSTSNSDSIITCYLYDYANTITSFKTAYMAQGFYNPSGLQVGTWSFSVLYNSTAAAINSIQVSDAQGVGNLTAGTILIYGVK